jgi:hypothetical protein
VWKWLTLYYRKKERRSVCERERERERERESLSHVRTGTIVLGHPSLRHVLSSACPHVFVLHKKDRFFLLLLLLLLIHF